MEFINGLAEYKKKSDEVVATDELLREWLFNKKTAEVIFAFEDEKEVGFALFFITFPHFLKGRNISERLIHQTGIQI